ncbi:CAP-associated domain-containing protein [Cytobacillus sp. Hz8]|uniref:CAP domain-containing protein n=1 Tax=Cytobacillus sp. Hz8 TaxID=3347168 RepID=UPI0035DBC135
MKRFLLIILFFMILYTTWPAIEKLIMKSDYALPYQTLKTDLIAWTNQDLEDELDHIKSTFSQVAKKLDIPINQLQSKKKDVKESVEKTDLQAPTKHLFSIHNIELGDTKAKVDQELGKAVRVTANEYGTKWYSYHHQYHNFMMVSFDDQDKVNGMYTNQALLSSSNGLKIGSPKNKVEQDLGQPVTKIRKGLTYYQIEGDQDYEMYLVDHSYVTIFYDTHKNNVVDAIQIINQNLEMKKDGFYGKESKPLTIGFEYQLFDLTNAFRVKHGQNILSWDDHIKETARDHSEDMAVHNYFSHTNLQGESPFDRMTEDDISFTLAGENLAYGQFSSIFAHEGLVNSLGHRKNILQKDFENLGVGVAFNKDSIPYYTENFYTN